MAKVSFEKALAKLEETVHRLEEGNLPLDEAVALFEEGTRLARACNEHLDAAELKVSQLVQSPGGEYHETDMHVAADAADAESRA
jgi:exodeoxyribonuclease VII small subunit